MGILKVSYLILQYCSCAKFVEDRNSWTITFGWVYILMCTFDAVAGSAGG